MLRFQTFDSQKYARRQSYGVLRLTLANPRPLALPEWYSPDQLEASKQFDSVDLDASSLPCTFVVLVYFYRDPERILEMAPRKTRKTGEGKTKNLPTE